MRIRDRIRFILALMTGVSLMLFGAGGHLLWVLITARARTVPPAKTRERLFRWQTTWSSVLLSVFSRIMDMTVRCDIPDRAVSDRAIVLANHRSWLDIFLVARALHGIGITRMTAVVKTSVGNIPVLGRFGRSIRCAFITRKDPEEDLKRIRECARHSDEDGASVILFPEGTRYRKDSARKAGYGQVLKPKVRGMHTLMQELPHYRLLLAIVAWPPGSEARRFTQGASLVGTTITVKVIDVRSAGSDVDAKTLLDDTWSRIDRDLSN